MITRPVMRYYGGKYRLASWICSHLPPHKIYVEPYGGAGSVLLRKTRAYSEVFNDLNCEIVNLFEVLRDPKTARQFQRYITLMPYSRVEFAKAYEPSADPVISAARMVYRSFAGHGSGAATGYKTSFRCNVTRSGSIPAHDWKNFPKAVEGFTERLRGVVIENEPALKIIERYDSPDALFYLDPPYTHGTRSTRHATVYSHEMSDADHIELWNVLRSVHGMVILSGYRSPLYDDLYSDWTRVDKQARADGRGETTESLWINPQALAAGTMFERSSND